MDDTQKQNPMPTDQPMVGGGVPGVTTPTSIDPNAPVNEPEQISPEPTAPVVPGTKVPTTVPPTAPVAGTPGQTGTNT